MKKILILWLIVWLMPLALLSQVSEAIDEACMKKATVWVEKLQLNDKGKEERVVQVVATHLTAIRDRKSVV